MTRLKPPLQRCSWLSHVSSCNLTVTLPPAGRKHNPVVRAAACPEHVTQTSFSQSINRSFSLPPWQIWKIRGNFSFLDLQSPEKQVGLKPLRLHDVPFSVKALSIHPCLHCAASQRAARRRWAIKYRPNRLLLLGAPRLSAKEHISTEIWSRVNTDRLSVYFQLYSDKKNNPIL